MTDTPTIATLLEKLAAVEKRLAQLEKLNGSNEQSVKDEGPDKEKKEAEQEEESTSRVKIVITVRDPDTGEPVVKDSKMTKNEGVDSAKYAFILKKNVYQNKSQTLQESNSEIDVISNPLWDLLKQHLSHYLYHIFQGVPITIESPFEPLVIYFDELRAAADTAVEGENEERKSAREDLRLLLNTISGGSSGDTKLDKYFKMRDGYKRQELETIQFEDLWTVFRPGMLVYGKPFQGEDQVFVVKDALHIWPMSDDSRTGKNFQPWELEAWSYDWSGQSFSRTLFVLRFEEFEGHRPLTSLPFFPFDVHPQRNEIRATLIERGRRLRTICGATKDRLFEYDGDAILERKGFSSMASDADITSEYALELHLLMMKQRRLESRASSSAIKSRVMVDYESFLRYNDMYARNGPLSPVDSGPECSCFDCQNNEGLTERCRTRFDEKTHSTAKVWEDEQYLLCPPRMLGYILREKQWAQLQLSKLADLLDTGREAAWYDRLKLADDHEPSSGLKKSRKGDYSTKAMLLDLVRSHISSSNPDDDKNDVLAVDDIIPGKGKGLVILLYGPPGVGKTSTAETISNALRKPLFSVSVADVGTDPKRVEANLSRIFELATSWQAILLIDEADVFLESRGVGGAVRSTDQNALVSVFLRVLEYYHGIMFLTTNQIRDFDIAIPSRIHVAISYASLNKKQMEAIFHGFLEKLDKSGLIEDYEGIRDWLEDEVYQVNFDGRQIRNIVTTALGLARAGSDYGDKPGLLTKEHLKKATDNARNFKDAFRDQLTRYRHSQDKIIKMTV